MNEIAKPDLEWAAFLPELLITAVAFTVLMVTLKKGRAWEITGLVMGMGGALAALLASLAIRDEAYYGVWGGQLDADGLAGMGRVLVYAITAVVLLIGFIGRARDGRTGEFLALTMLASAGMGIMLAAGSLVSLFVGLELFSIALYVLVSLEADREHPLEAGMKYLIVGGVAAAFYLYGAALLFGATGSFGIIAIGEAGAEVRGPMFWVGGALVLGAILFKAAAVPLHWWAPDVYEGSPTATVAFMATAVKVVAVVTLIRLLVFMLGVEKDAWEGLIEVLAVLSIVLGNFGALAQTSIKRMLAWSGIAHIGYILVGFAAWAATSSTETLSVIMYALVAYSLVTLGSFAILIARERVVGRELSFDDFNGIGLGSNAALGSSIGGLAMVIAMLSLAGIPLTGGFIAKFGLFSAAVDADLTWLAVIGILGSLVSLGYYLKLPIHMFFKDKEPRRVHEGMHRGLAAVGAALALAVIAIGFAPMSIFDAADESIQTIEEAPVASNLTHGFDAVPDEAPAE